MTIDPAGSVVRTLGEVFNEVQGMRQDVRDLTHSVQAAVGQLGDHETRLRTVERDGATAQEVEDLRKDFAAQLKTLRDEYGPRVSSLEKRVWAAVGAATVSVGGSGLVAYLTQRH